MLVVPMLLMYSGGMNVVNAAESSKTIEYNCLGSAAGLIDVDIDMDVTVSATAPDTVEPGANFEIENSYTDIDMTITEVMRTATNPLVGEVLQFNLDLDNATTNEGEDVVNVASEPLSFGPIEFTDDDETVGFRVPGEGGIDVDLIAGEEGNVKITAGEIVTSVSALGILDVEVTCTPLDGQDTLLNTISIGESEDPEDPEEPEDPKEPEDPEQPGEDGKDGKDGEDGKDGKDGEDGKDGVDGKDADKSEEGGELPKTATNNPLLMLLGSLITVAGGALVFIRRKVLN